MFNVKAAAQRQPTEDYHLILQLLSALQSILVAFRSLFWLHDPQLYCFGSIYC